MLGPNYRRPVVNAGEDWIESSDVAVLGDQQQFHDWWSVLGDPMLDELVQAAYQQNLPLRTAGLRVLEARTQRQIAAANLLPQSQNLFGQFAHNELSQNSATASPFAPQGFDDWQTGFDLSWEIDVWGRIRRSIEGQDAAIAIEVESYDDILVTLIGDVGASYIELRAIDERIRIAEDNIAIQDESLRLANVRYDLEDVSELDVEQAKANLNLTRASIPALRQARRQSLNLLAILLGMTPQQLEPILRESGRIPDAPKQVVVGIPADLLRRRPDIRAAERQVAAQSAQIGIAEAELYPQFGLNGQLALNAENFGDLFNSGSLGGAIVPGFSWKILNYGRLRNGIRVEELRFQQAVTQYEDAVLNANREVEDAMALFLRSKEQAEALEKAVEATMRAVKLVRVQYKEGETEFNQVFVLESNLVSAQDQLVVAQSNIAIGLVRVYKALGGGWELRLGNRYQGNYPLATVSNEFVPIEEVQPLTLPIRDEGEL